MSSLSQVRQGLHSMWDNLQEGWHSLRDRAGEAITRFNPTHKVDDNPAERSLYNRTSRWGLLAAEVSENTDAVHVSIEAPGMEADDFDISIAGNDLYIRGEKQFKNEDKNDRYHILECAYGRFERVLPLPAQIDETRTEAKYKRGVLHITLPKLETARARKIEIKSIH